LPRLVHPLPDFAAELTDLIRRQAARRTRIGRSARAARRAAGDPAVLILPARTAFLLLASLTLSLTLLTLLTLALLSLALLSLTLLALLSLTLLALLSLTLLALLSLTLLALLSLTLLALLSLTLLALLSLTLLALLALTLLALLSLALLTLLTLALLPLLALALLVRAVTEPAIALLGGADPFLERFEAAGEVAGLVERFAGLVAAGSLFEAVDGVGNALTDFVDVGADLFFEGARIFAIGARYGLCAGVANLLGDAIVDDGVGGFAQVAGRFGSLATRRARYIAEVTLQLVDLSVLLFLLLDEAACFLGALRAAHFIEPLHAVADLVLLASQLVGALEGRLSLFRHSLLLIALQPASRFLDFVERVLTVGGVAGSGIGRGAAHGVGGFLESASRIL
jgi:hypothetical protein